MLTKQPDLILKIKTAKLNLMINYLIFVLSLLGLVFSANFLVSSAKKLSALFKLSPLIIGATVVALGTSMPEFSVAVSSIIQKVPSLSMGDIIGSSIVNVCIILGISILFFPIRVGTEKTQRNNLITLLLTASFIGIFFIPLDVRKFLALGLLSFYVVFLIMEFVWGKEGRKHEDKKAIEKMEKIKGSPIQYVIKIFLSLLGLILSGKFLVSSAVGISTLLGLESEIIGLTIIAIGTSLPELSTSIISGVNDEDKLLVGDIQGSNIFNLSVLGTLILIFANTKGESHDISLIFLAVSTLSTALITHTYSGKNIPRVFGGILIMIYILYLRLLL